MLRKLPVVICMSSEDAALEIRGEEKENKSCLKDLTEPGRFGTSASPKVRCRYDLRRRRLLSLD